MEWGKKAIWICCHERVIDKINLKKAKKRYLLGIFEMLHCNKERAIFNFK